MSTYSGKYTVKDSTSLHKGDPQPHDINGTEKPEAQPDYAGGRSASKPFDPSLKYSDGNTGAKGGE